MSVPLEVPALLEEPAALIAAACWLTSDVEVASDGGGRASMEPKHAFTVPRLASAF
jgi:hypothetical protein